MKYLLFDSVQVSEFIKIVFDNMEWEHEDWFCNAMWFFKYFDRQIWSLCGWIAEAFMGSLVWDFT